MNATENHEPAQPLAFPLSDQLGAFGSQYSDELCCNWISWGCIGRGVLALHLPVGDCCDMTGAINVAKMLMPDVREIRTYSGDGCDTIYQARGSQWVALTRDA